MQELHKKLQNLWENKVPLGWRHIVKRTKEEKRKRLINHLKQHVVNQLDFTDIKTVLDWGCGGGILAKEFLNHVDDIILCDISNTSLKNAVSHIGKTVRTILLNNLETEFPSNIDLLHCYGVIYHFPSLEYYHNVVNVWLKIKPNYITLGTFIDNKIKEQKKYFEGHNYLRGLLMPREEIIKPFLNDYQEDYFSQNEKSGYFILKCKDKEND